METKFSPNLLDNDPNFEHKPGKVIKVNSQAWFDWLVANDSFRFNAGDNSYRARKEYNIPAKTDYWYAVKKVNGKLHKKFIGKTEQVTHARLIEISRIITQPPHPRKPQPQETSTTPQETSAPDLMELIKSLSLRLDNLEKKHMIETAEVVDIKGFEDAIARLKDELANKDMQLTELANELTSKDIQLSELANELTSKDIQLTELANELTNANSKLTELANELTSKDIQLSELANELTSKDIQLSELAKQLANANSKLIQLTNELTNKDIQLDNCKQDVDNPEDIAPVDNCKQDENKTKLINLLGLDDILGGDLYNADSLKKEGYFKAIADNKAEIKKISGIEVKLADDLTDINTLIKWLGYKSTRTTKNKVSYSRVTEKIEP